MIIVKVGRSDFVEASVAHEIGHALFQDIIENNGRHMLAFSKDFTIVDEIRDEIEKIIENLYGENWRTSLAGYDWIGKTTNGLRLYKYIVERDMSKESLKQSQISDQFVDMFAAADDFKYFARNHSSAPMPLGEMIADAFAVCYTSPDDLGKYIPRTRAAFEKFLIGQYT